MTTRYRCRECGRDTSKENVKGVRIRNPCPACQAVTTFERV